MRSTVMSARGGAWFAVLSMLFIGGLIGAGIGYTVGHRGSDACREFAGYSDQIIRTNKITDQTVAMRELAPKYNDAKARCLEESK